MANVGSVVDADTRLDMSTVLSEEYTLTSDCLEFFTEQEQKWLSLDINEPDSLARDLLMDRYTNHDPSFQDFAEAVSFMMNTAKYVERIQILIKYDRHLFFKQRPESKNVQNYNVPASLSQVDGCMREKSLQASETKTSQKCYINEFQPVIYGESLLKVLQKVIDMVEGRDECESEDDYLYRREQTAINFVTSFYHFKHYEQEKHLQEDQQPSLHQQITANKFLFETFKEAKELFEAKQYKEAAAKYLDGAFACMCRLRQDNGKTTNVLRPLLQRSIGENTNEQTDGVTAASENPNIVSTEIDQKMSQIDLNSSKTLDDSVEIDPSNWISSCEESGDESEECDEFVPHDLLFLQCEILLANCYLLDKQLKKASHCAKNLMNWMCRKQYEGTVGYYARYFTTEYCTLQSYFGEAEWQLGNYQYAINGCSHSISRYIGIGHQLVTFDQNMYAIRKNFFDRLIDVWDINNSLNVDRRPDCDSLDIDSVEECRSNAKIVVDANRKKGMINNKTQFVVNDIDSALRIAKDGDTIFLEEGTYSGCKSGKKKDGTKQKMIEILKDVTIIGIHTSKVRLLGSIVKKSKGKVTFQNVTFQVGKDQESADSIYLMSGNTTMTNCCIKSPVNTAVNVISDSPVHDTSLDLIFCIIDGMQLCERILNFEGFRPVINIENCHVSDTLGFCVIIKPDSKCSVKMNVLNTLFIGVQDGIKIMLHHDSPVPSTFEVRGCHFELKAHRKEDGSPSIAYCQTSGVAKLENNYIYIHDHDAPYTGISLHSLKLAEITMNLIESTAEVPRQFSNSQGVMITECLKTVIASTEINGMRIGIKFANKIENEDDSVKIDDSIIKCCSVGLLISKSQPELITLDGPDNVPQQTENEEDGNILVTNSSKLHRLQLKLKDDYVLPNIYLKMTGCFFDTCYYGLMNETEKGQISLEQNTFNDIPKAILLSNECLGEEKVELVLNEFQLSESFDYSDINFEESREVENLRRVMYIQFSVNANIPHRIAYQKCEYFLVSSHCDQAFLFENNLASCLLASMEKNEGGIIEETSYKEIV